MDSFLKAELVLYCNSKVVSEEVSGINDAVYLDFRAQHLDKKVI